MSKYKFVSLWIFEMFYRMLNNKYYIIFYAGSSYKGYKSVLILMLCFAFNIKK